MTRFAILSDIHSNNFALEAVIDDALSKGVGRFIDLGDTYYGPISPHATYGLLRSLPLTSIMGNQDRLLLDADPEIIAQNPTLAFVLDDLPDVTMRLIRARPSFASIASCIFACHGSPENDTDYFLENIESGSPVLKSLNYLSEKLVSLPYELILCGHTHIPRWIQLPNGKNILNPGSVGLQAYADDHPCPHVMETGNPKARYAILDLVDADEWRAELRTVSYDYEYAADIAKANGRKDWADCLRYGRISA